MATVHGTLEAFDPAKEDWTSYAERLKFYFIANDITSAVKKRAILLCSCGAKTHKLLKSLVQGDLEATAYAELLRTLKEYHDPAPSAIVQRFKFNTRVRKQGEGIAQYVAALRELAEQCNYGTSLPDMLRDRLVCGVNHEATQRRLLSEKDLTYEKALELATTIEMTEKNVKTLTSQAAAKPPGSPEVHHVEEKSVSQTPGCYRCGGAHKPMVCKFREAECHYCKKKGHIAPVCRAKLGNAKAKGKARETMRTHYLEAERDSEVPEHETYPIYTMQGTACSSIRVHVTIDSIPVEMEYDTGAAYSLLNEATYKRIASKGKKTLQPPRVRLRTYTGEEIKVLGSFQAEVKCGENREELLMHVVEGTGPNLMGRDSLGKFQVNIGNIHQLWAVGMRNFKGY